jgi:preprotein translocase subunit SecA
MTTLYADIERAIKVNQFYRRDEAYVVRDGEICIVDEFTGRIAEGRKWREGIHQAVEAKEGVEISPAGGQAARITVQDFFLRYQHVAGMSGTVSNSARELKRIFKLRVGVIPTNRPPVRKRLAERIFATAAEKWQSIVQEVVEVHATGRPVLIGTRSIDKSEQLSELLTAAGIEHQVLNAHHIAHEAEIVAQAGQRGRVTVSTNMAGRGTDIKLGPGVAEPGGMHVISTELHDAARIDRQLIGRCGRQGDPGSYRQYMSLDDDILLRGFDADWAERLRTRFCHSEWFTEPKRLSRLSRLFLRAQRRVERENLRRRQALLFHERQVQKGYVQMGLDPHLDSVE